MVPHQFLNKPSFSDQALSNALDGSLIALKLRRNRPAERNTVVDTIEQRYDYARWLMVLTWSMRTSFSLIDEFGINIHTRRNQGRSKKATDFITEHLVNAAQISRSVLLFQIAKG